MKRLKIDTTKGQKLFLTSDTHFSHKNICGGTTNWAKFPTPYNEWYKNDPKELRKFCLDNGVRPFPTVEKMNDELIDGINRTVGQDDILIHAGDWSFGGQENIKIFRDRIICQHIHLIYGNHDEHIEDDRNDFKRLFESVNHYKEISVDGVMVCIFHYKQSIWNKSHKDAYHAYGHSHSSAEHITIGKSMDVGVDNAYKLLGEYRPFSFNEFVSILKNRQVQEIDHHKSK